MTHGRAVQRYRDRKLRRPRAFGVIVKVFGFFGSETRITIQEVQVPPDTECQFTLPVVTEKVIVGLAVRSLA